MHQLQRLLTIMAQLRDPESGCPWDIKQTFATIAPYTLEEAYEVQDAIDREDWDDLRGELGDLLLQVVFHARMAEEQKLFAFEDVAQSIADKMTRRHPHVFADSTVADDAELRRVWEDEKAAERAEKSDDASLMAGVANNLPALLRGVKLQKRASRAGFDWGEVGPVLAKIREELDELEEEIQAGASKLRQQDELGDILFACSNLARHLDIDPEQAARGTNAKFERRFRYLESKAAEAGAELKAFDLDQQEAWWVEAKSLEKAKP